ncbi:MAG: TIGR01777 family oxidoreductase [Acidobacteriota bacterium]
MSRFTSSVDLPVDQNEAWAWHLREGAFGRLTPPWQRIEMLEPGPVENGSRATFRLYKGPVPITWVAEHRDVEPPGQFVDVQLSGPFAHWHHRHRFEAIDDSHSRLHDELDFKLPLGILGSLGAGSVRGDLERVFRYRHATTREDLQLHADFRDRERLTVAIAGAGGMVGRVLSALLTTGGHRVLRLVRRQAKAADEVTWDPANGVARPADLEGVDALVYLAGAGINDGRWTPRFKKLIRSSRVDAMKNLVQSLAQLENPPGVLVSASGMSVYRQGGGPHDEDSAPDGEGFLADVVRDWEAEVIAAESLGMRTVQLRLGVVLSPQGGALAAMLPSAQVGMGGALGSGDQMLSWISIDDAASAILVALMNDELSGPVNLTAPEVISQRRFAQILGRVLRRPAFARVPQLAVDTLVGAEKASETVLADLHVVPRRLQEIGFRFRHPDASTALGHVLGRDVGVSSS